MAWFGRGFRFLNRGPFRKQIQPILEFNYESLQIFKLGRGDPGLGIFFSASIRQQSCTPHLPALPRRGVFIQGVMKPTPTLPQKRSSLATPSHHFSPETHMGVSLNGGTPISHPKMIIFSRKTHCCWVLPFKETPI